MKCKRYQRRQHRRRGCNRPNRKPKPAPKPAKEGSGTKQGPFCDPRVWAPPPNPEECEPFPVGVEPIVTECPESGFTCHPEKPDPEEPEEVSEATEMKMVLFTETKDDPPTEAVWGCAKVHTPDKHNTYVRFMAVYGSFSSAVWGGWRGPAVAPVVCSEYINPPCAECVSDNIDTAWAVVFDLTTHTFVESERVRFNFENPEEDVSNIHPGVG
jgi:hypothetical protein